MPSNRALRATFATAVGMEIANLAVPVNIAVNTTPIAFVLGYALLAIFGFLATREGHRYRYVASATFAFVGLWLAGGLINIVVGRGVVPSDWTPEKNRLALWGYVFATALFLPVAFASSGLGVFAARLASKLRHRPPNAP